MKFLHLLLVALLLMGTHSFPTTAWADDPTTRAARRAFDKADKLFALGRFDEALEQYQKAFDAKPIPDFLFNIGQCYRNLNDYDSAIFSFQKFLTLDPETPRREAVEQLINELEGKKAQAELLARERKAAEKNQPPVAKKPSITKRWWFWTGLVTIAAAGGGTAYFLTRDDGVPSSDLGNINFPK